MWSPALAGGGPRNVLVVINSRSTASYEIGMVYKKARNIPQKNLLYISCPTDEFVSRDVYLDNIFRPIHNCLQRPEMAEIDYIVLTKGVPLGVYYEGPCTPPYSLTSMLTCAAYTEPPGPIINPYGPLAYFEKLPCSPEIYWSSKHTFNGKRYYNVTRLDAFTVDDVKRMIESSVKATRNGTVLLDKMTGLSGAYYTANERMGTQLDSAYEKLVSRGINTILDDTSAFVSNTYGLIGYFSWCSNDPNYTHERYTSHIFVPGSIMDGYYSFSARTFKCPGTTKRGSLIADLFPKGLCAAGGYVSEPMLSTATYPNILFDRYTKGFNMAESFFAACPELFWKTTVVGDPLMAPFATPPVVRFINTGPLTGTEAKLKAEASDQSGIGKVEFYLDDILIGTATSAPYEITFDSTQFIVGPHNLTITAYENSPVYTQGSTSALVEIVNTVSSLKYISQAGNYADGQIVKITGKVVTAATGTVRPGFYIEEPDRSAGIYVASQMMVPEGAVVEVIGPVSTLDGERIISAQSTSIVINDSATVPKPVGMSNAALGGAAVGNVTVPIGKGKGVRNVGLLVRTWGKVTAVGTGWFYIDDGSKCSDGTGITGIKVISTANPAPGSFVTVTGICSSEKVGTKFSPVIRTRRASDVQLTITGS